MQEDNLIKELEERIELAREARSAIKLACRQLEDQYNSGILNYEDYFFRLSKALKGKSEREWREYYNEYIKTCKAQIRQHDKLIQEEKLNKTSKVKNNLLLNGVLIALLLVLALSGLYFTSNYVGYAPLEITGNTVDNITAENVSNIADTITGDVTIAKDTQNVVEVTDLITTTYRDASGKRSLPADKKPSQIEINPSKKVYSADDEPTFEITLKEKRNLITGLAVGIEENEFDVKLIEPNGKIIDITNSVTRVNPNSLKVKLEKRNAFRPGVYHLLVESNYTGEVYVNEESFSWGVLAINVDKSIYLPEEEAFIGIAVLDDIGRVVCNAGVTLEIISPFGDKKVLTTADGSIKVSPECEVLGVTKLPDYYTNYKVSRAGSYVTNLTAVTFNGARSIQDNFIVQNSVEFDVARNGPTRIFPPVPYVMNFTIKSNKDYTGVIKEYVPASFEITQQDGLTVTTIGDTKLLLWNKNLVSGEIYNINYKFDALDISPEFYLLGPLEIGDWKEARQWQIASDAVEKIDDTTLSKSASSIDVGQQLTITFAGNCIGDGGQSCSGLDMWLESAVGGGTEIPATNCVGGQILKTVSVDFSSVAALEILYGPYKDVKQAV